MPPRAHLPGFEKLVSFRGAGVRTGIYTGVCLSLIFLGWLVVANRMPVLERFALERNLAAAAAIAFFSLVPVLRFPRIPRRLWVSGAIAWGLLSLTYRLMSFFFPGLSLRYSALQVFMVGAVVYTIAATVCWIMTVVWRLRPSNAGHEPLPNSPTSSSHRMH